jgi:lipopolysaccharide exporter
MSEPAAGGKSIARRTAVGAGWIMAWRMLNRSLGLVSTLILVRLLEPTDFGLVAIATGFIASVDALSALGVQDALVREPERSRDLYDTGFGLNLIRGLITAVLIALLAYPLADFFSDSRLAVVMFVLAAGMVMTPDFPDGLLYYCTL